MKKIRVLFLAIIFIVGCFGMALSEQSPEQQNLNTVRSLELGKIYKFPNYFDLIDVNMEIVSRDFVRVECNKGKINIGQTSTGVITYITYRDPAVTLYGMRIRQTRWNDPIVENSYFIKQEISPDGKTVTKYYRSEDNNKFIEYVAMFHAMSYKDPLILVQFTKRYTGDPC